MEIRKPIPVSIAVEKVIQHSKRLPIIEIDYLSSLGYSLAEPIVAKHDVPSFNCSPYDGFAVRSIDTQGASSTKRILFNVIDHVAAGKVSNKTIGPFEAIRIMTGAMIPKGADCVVMFEQTLEYGNNFTIRKPFKPNENISLQGEEAKKGEELIPAGTLIHPGTIALLATFGYHRVKVRRKPKVGIICTGSELINVEEELVPGKVRNSNGPMIMAQLARMGIEGTFYGIFPDDLDTCLSLIKQAFKENDLVITIGGVSVGDFDFLPQLYKELEAEVLFNKVAMRPGSVTTVALLDGKLLFSLSGNPSACFTAFELFVRPAIQTMMGNRKVYLPQVKAYLGEDFLKPNHFIRFVRSVYEYTDGRPIIRPAAFNKSNAVSTIAKGNAIMVLPDGTRNFKAGDLVDVLLLGMEDGVETWTI